VVEARISADRSCFSIGTLTAPARASLIVKGSFRRPAQTSSASSHGSETRRSACSARAAFSTSAASHQFSPS
jgi:hypothetical protein